VQQGLEGQLRLYQIDCVRGLVYGWITMDASGSQHLHDGCGLAGRNPFGNCTNTHNRQGSTHTVGEMRHDRVVNEFCLILVNWLTASLAFEVVRAVWATTEPHGLPLPTASIATWKKAIEDTRSALDACFGLLLR